jgi:two-component system, NtrC family, nitrogen regulation sensor histidine kinase NtrY
MRPNRFKGPFFKLASDEKKRRKRDYFIIAIVVVLVSIISLYTVKSMRFVSDTPMSNMVLMFILLNIDMLLILFLIFLVFRNLVKLLVERRRKVEGTRLRTKLVAAFITLTLLPATVLFFFAVNFITSSMEFWFKIPIDQALQNSLAVGRNIYRMVEENNIFFLDKTAYQIVRRNLLVPENVNELANYIQIAQREFNLDIVEVYDAAGNTRLASSLAEKLSGKTFAPVAADALLRGETLDANTWSMSENISTGEVVRNIAAIPLGAKGDAIQGFVVISVLIPPNLSQSLTSISKGFEEYQQTKLLKQPVRLTYYITMTIVSLLVVFCAVWFGMYLSKTITIPIMELAEGTRRVSEGDLTHNITVEADDEIKTLVNSFNKMTRDLRYNRVELELYAKKLFDQNIEIEARRRYMEIVLNNVSAGVISLDARGLVSTINRAAEKMLHIEASEIIKKSYLNILKSQHKDLGEEIYDRFWGKREESLTRSITMTIAGKRKSFIVNFNALKDDAGQQIGLVMVFDDMTELEKAQRMAAWREVARRIAHEVKNPLTPISLSAQRLWRKYKDKIDDPVFEECTKTIIDHTELIRNLVNEFSTFAKFPTANPQPNELAPIIHETVALYREGHPNITFNIDIADNIPILNLDRQQFKQTLINLIDNAIAAIRTEGAISISLSHDVPENKVKLVVADTGLGISDLEKPYLFEPDFTTKKTGMGLGLAIVSTIISDHKGKIYAQDNEPHGARFIIELPV